MFDLLTRIVVSYVMQLAHADSSRSTSRYPHCFLVPAESCLSSGTSMNWQQQKMTDLLKGSCGHDRTRCRSSRSPALRTNRQEEFHLHGSCSTCLLSRARKDQDTSSPSSVHPGTCCRKGCNCLSSSGSCWEKRYCGLPCWDCQGAGCCHRLAMSKQ